MGLLVGDVAVDDWEELNRVIAAIQTWVGKQEGLNAQFGGIEGRVTPVPTGSMCPWGTSTAPTGYLLCNGQGVLRTTYASLFAVIGVTFGVGDGSTTFNVPDLRQKFVLGVAASGTGSTLAGTGGTIDHTHTGPSHTHTGPSHTHTISGATSQDSLAYADIFDTAAVQSGAGTTVIVPDAGLGFPFTVNHSHTEGTLATAAAGTGATGAGGTGATGTGNPPFMALHWIIKT